MPEHQNWRRVYSRLYTDAILSHCRRRPTRPDKKGFLEEEAFKATIIKDFFTGSKTYKAYYDSSHDEDCMIITALLLAEWRDACAFTLAQAPAAMRGDTDIERRLPVRVQGGVRMVANNPVDRTTPQARDCPNPYDPPLSDRD